MTTNKGLMLGADALDLLNDNTQGFTSLKRGDSFLVKVISLQAVMSAITYGSFKDEVYSFVSETPPTLNKNRYAVDNLTEWDKAYNYCMEQSNQFEEDSPKYKEWRELAKKYRLDIKFAFTFINLEDGNPITFSFSRAQFQTLLSILKEIHEDDLATTAFKLGKTSPKVATETKVTLTPIMNPKRDLTDVEYANLMDEENVNVDLNFMLDLFNVYGVEKQVEMLHKTGFDVTVLGHEAPKEDEGELPTSDDTQSIIDIM